MSNVTSELLETHRVIRTITDKLYHDDPRFPELAGTLHRVVSAHAWFEERFLYPALAERPGWDEGLFVRLTREHRELDALLSLLKSVPCDRLADRGDAVHQLQEKLAGHLKAEEELLYPLAERLLDEAASRRLAEEMDRRKSEVRDLVF